MTSGRTLPSTTAIGKCLWAKVGAFLSSGAACVQPVRNLSSHHSAASVWLVAAPGAVVVVPGMALADGGRVQVVGLR